MHEQMVRYDVVDYLVAREPQLDHNVVLEIRTTCRCRKSTNV